MVVETFLAVLIILIGAIAVTSISVLILLIRYIKDYNKKKGKENDDRENDKE